MKVKKRVITQFPKRKPGFQAASPNITRQETHINNGSSVPTFLYTQNVVENRRGNSYRTNGFPTRSRHDSREETSSH
jgi:hypothetical protein